MRSCRVRSVYLTTLLLGRLSPLNALTSIVYILSPETDKYPSWISGRKRMAVENISWSNLHERILLTWRGSNPQPPDHQLDAHPTKPPRQATNQRDLYIPLPNFISGGMKISTYFAAFSRHKAAVSGVPCSWNISEALSMNCTAKSISLFSLLNRPACSNALQYKNVNHSFT